MIKVEDGKVNVEGTGAEILAEITVLIKAIARNCGISAMGILISIANTLEIIKEEE